MRLVSDDCTGEAYGCANRINRTADFVIHASGCVHRRVKKMPRTSLGWKRERNMEEKEQQAGETAPPEIDIPLVQTKLSITEPFPDWFS